MCEQCDNRYAESGVPGGDAMPLEEAVQIAAGVRHRQDGTSRAFDALLREIDLLRIKIDCHEKAALRQAEEMVRLNEEKKRWDSLRGLSAEEAGCGA